jgi:predicted RNase H-like HicB family nuclease
MAGGNAKERQYIHLTILVREEEGQYCSWCPELDVASCGSTIDEASSNLKEAVTLYLKTVTELGELDQVFQEKGLKLKSENEDQYGTFMSAWQAPIEAMA